MIQPTHFKLPTWEEKSKGEQVESLKQLVQDLYGYVLSEPMEQIRKTLHNHQPVDEKESQDVATALSLMNVHANLLNMNCEIGHFTGSALVVNPRKNQFLLHYHKKLHKWLQFGGHPDFETDLLQVALRETREETGLTDLQCYPKASSKSPIDVDIHTIPQKGDQPEHVHIDFRYVLATNEPEKIEIAEGESQEMRWFNFDVLTEVEGIVDQSLLRMIQKVKKLLKQTN